MNSEAEKILICAWCGQPTVLISLHGYYQCYVCGTKMEKSCDNELCYSSIHIREFQLDSKDVNHE